MSPGEIEVLGQFRGFPVDYCAGGPKLEWGQHTDLSKTISLVHINHKKVVDISKTWNHKKTHVFDNIGLQDITSLVNFGELINITNQFNLNIVSYCNQRDFLITNGILQRKEILKKNLPKAKREIIEQQFQRLTDKNSMGKDFKFFIVSP